MDYIEVTSLNKTIEAIPAYNYWINTSSLQRQMFLKRQYLGIKLNGVQNRFKLILSPIAKQ